MNERKSANPCGYIRNRHQISFPKAKTIKQSTRNNPAPIITLSARSLGGRPVTASQAVENKVPAVQNRHREQVDEPHGRRNEGHEEDEIGQPFGRHLPRGLGNGDRPRDGAGRDLCGDDAVKPLHAAFEDRPEADAAVIGRLEQPRCFAFESRRCWWPRRSCRSDSGFRTRLPGSGCPACAG